MRIQEQLTVVHSMSEIIAHRGPDSSGFWQDGDCGVTLGHRRLSIVDLSPAGSQPMVSHSGRFVIVFNGEIYNYSSLRALLSAEGAVFQGRSDTEVLLAGVEVWGLGGTLKRAFGMFAFAIWDRKERVLSLARDRVGEKPLYWYRRSGVFAFASELKSIMQVPGVPRSINTEALASYLRFSYVPTPQCIISGVNKLEPGTYREFRFAPDVFADRAHTFWSAADAIRAGIADPLPNDDRGTIDTLEDVLTEVVRDQMVSDVELGAFLSGGVDSSLIVGIMQRLSAKPVRTFTIGFSDRRYDASQSARAVAEHLGTTHQELVVSPEDALAVVPRLPAIYDEPFADASQIPTFLVSGLARRHVSVALSGDGGDEMFAGYTRYLWAPRLWSMLSMLPPRLRRFAAAGARRHRPATWNWIGEFAAQGVLPSLRVVQAGDKIGEAINVLDAGSLDEVYDRLVSTWYDGPMSLLGASSRGTAWPQWVDAAEAPRQPLPRMQFRDVVGFLTDDVLVKVDRAAMAVSLETRAPFLDPRVLSFAFRLPIARRISDGEMKWALRRLLMRYVPASIVDRPKQGFTVPIAEWLRGPLRSWAGDLLSSEMLSRTGLFDIRSVTHLWNAHQRGTANNAAGLWNLLMFMAWFDSKNRAWGLSS